MRLGHPFPSMPSFTVLGLLLAGRQVACSTETSPAHCGALGAEAECRELGSVLLQVASDSLLQKTRVADRAATRAQLTEKEATTARSVAHEQLTQYTELKATLSKSKESADVMRMIDDALDGDLSKKSRVQKAKNKHKKLRKAVKKKVAKHPKNPGFSLLETGAAELAPHSKAAPVTVKNVKQEDEDDADAESGEEDNAASNEEEGTEENEDAKGEDADEGAEESEEGEADSEEESEEDSEEESEEGTEEDGGEEEEGSANEEDAEEEEDDDDDPEGSLSMVAVRGMTKAESAALDENGYEEVAEAFNNRGMERFITRLANEMSMEITDPGGLKGMVPFFSGMKSSQSFAALRAELRSVSHERNGWVVRRKRRHENILLQTATAEHQEHAGEHQASLSLLGTASTRVSRVAQKVPDLAVALFGSRTLVLLCTAALVTVLFCLDEKKRTSKGVYEDPLSLDPMPPPSKEDPYVAASLTILRGPKNTPAS